MGERESERLQCADGGSCPRGEGDVTGPRRARALLFGLFALSGFSGLIYESIWSHYLKLFLGHAAYAQTLVLALFMGGMAVGAWVAARASARWRNLLLGYALAEAFLGVLGLAFHRLFEAGTGLAYAHALPALADPGFVLAFKWTLGAALIAPQSIALGMTFPLMSGALIRRFPHGSGASLAMLYFTNSLGAALGVLASGFVLIAHVGLPGTIMAAGLLNCLLATVVWLVARDGAWRAGPRALPTAARARAPEPGRSGPGRLLLAAAFVTGCASFIYEIGWVRMLSLVLGSSTHAFEMMLSAFILGLALGSLWVRGRIDRFADPVRALAFIQLLMGGLALATLVLYGGAFELMAFLLERVARTDAGYLAFNMASHGIAFVLMLPATFCAGMTLPLITHALMAHGGGERSIGAVYAANTLGAIAGIALAVHLAMPALGLKGLIALGAALDMALGVALLGRAVRTPRVGAVAVAGALSVAALGAVVLGVSLDARMLASGVYRYASTEVLGGAEVPFHRDGKTATVNLIWYPAGVLSLTTNGKPDATISLLDRRPVTSDELTMTLIAALPLALRPEARSAAVIGFGSGLTTHVLLAAPRLERVETIEIEPAMIEAARHFGARVERAYRDPRSRIHIEDAKTFFAVRPRAYDLIISEPSHPWVSGVASLYTREFYALAAERLRPGGVFAQWLHANEMSLPLLASVIKAIAGSFPDYVIYNSNDRDLIILAGERLPGLDGAALLGHSDLRRELARIGVRTVQDLTARRVGTRALLGPYLEGHAVPANSDYFPILDLNAVRARFLGERVTELLDLPLAPLPVVEMLETAVAVRERTDVTPGPYLRRLELTYLAMGLRDRLLDQPTSAAGALPEWAETRLQPLETLLDACQAGESGGNAFDALLALAELLVPALTPAELDPIWARLHARGCTTGWDARERAWVALLEAVSRREARSMAERAGALLAGGQAGSAARERYLMAAAMLGHLAAGAPDAAAVVWRRYGGASASAPLLRLLLAYTRHAIAYQHARAVREAYAGPAP